VDKVRSLEELVADVPAGALVALGGGGLVRKPLAACAALALRGTNVDITVFLGGPDVDLMLGMGVVDSLQFAYVGMDALGLAPNFRTAREEDALPVVEWTEAMYIAGVEATCRGLPFMPSITGPGAELLELPGAPFKRFQCPITGRTLTAVPAIKPDVLLLHATEADREGNVRLAGDGFLDPYLARAAGRVLVTADRIVDHLPVGISEHETTISRLWVTAVAAVPGGSGFTSSYPEWTVDYPRASEYVARARDIDWLTQYCLESLEGAAQ
jgi:glutaconate CoA-transferase, subunit A